MKNQEKKYPKYFWKLLDKKSTHIPLMVTTIIKNIFLSISKQQNLYQAYYILFPYW